LCGVLSICHFAFLHGQIITHHVGFIKRNSFCAFSAVGTVLSWGLA
jgi:hypothetical protein